MLHDDEIVLWVKLRNFDGGAALSSRTSVSVRLGEIMVTELLPDWDGPLALFLRRLLLPPLLYLRGLFWWCSQADGRRSSSSFLSSRCLVLLSDCLCSEIVSRYLSLYFSQWSRPN